MCPHCALHRSRLGTVPAIDDSRLRRQLADCLRSLPGSQSAWVVGPRLVLRFANVGLSAWELDCHASADQHVAGRPPCPVIPEYPLSTDRIPSIGHATGTLPACHARGAQAPDLLIRSYITRARLHGCAGQSVLRRTGTFPPGRACCGTPLLDYRPFWRTGQPRAVDDVDSKFRMYV